MTCKVTQMLHPEPFVLVSDLLELVRLEIEHGLVIVVPQDPGFVSQIPNFRMRFIRNP